MFLKACEVREKGLEYIGFVSGMKSEHRKEKSFRSFYGSSSLDVASLWHDLSNTEIPGAVLMGKEKSGLKYFLMAIHFLWAYPKNAEILACQFKVNNKYSQGKHLWKWITKIQSMKAKVITWDCVKSERFPITVDGVDCRVWEPRKHCPFPIDPTYSSHKMKHAAFKYELGVSVYHQKLVWINGPFKGGTNDITIFQSGLNRKIGRNQKAIADRGYNCSNPDDARKLATPNNTDSKELKNFKSRARARHETVNGRIKNFACAAETFRHGMAKHKIAFEAVCVMVQYQMDNGSHIFEV